MKAYKRIKKLAEVVDGIIQDGAVVADVACDHGYLAELLHRNNKIKTVYAIDISKDCLKKVINLKNDFALTKVVPLLGDGLKPVSKVDVAVIAGVGGLEIIKMITRQNKLESGENKCNIFIFQPAQNVFEFRKWIYDNHFCIISDFLVEDAKRFYPIIVVDVTKTQKNEKSLYNLYCGRDNDIQSVTFRNFLISSLENFAYIEEISLENIEKDDILREKYQIYNLVKKLLNQTGGNYVRNNTKIPGN